MMDERITLGGAPGSPYTRKMLALLRYRRLPYRFIHDNPAAGAPTAPAIEGSYKRFLKLFDAHIRNGPYVFGKRPGAADFGIYGQLTQPAGFDPTPMAITLNLAPQVYAWVHVVEDLSGLEPGDDDWYSRVALPGTLRDLLCEVGRVYAPALLANAAAVDSGAEQVRTEIDGREWVQKPFPLPGQVPAVAAPRPRTPRSGGQGIRRRLPRRQRVRNAFSIRI